MKDLISKIDYSSIQQYIIRDNDCRLQAYIAKEFGFNTIVAGASSLPFIYEIVKDTNIKIAATVAYPSGAYPGNVKAQEVADLLEYDSRIDEIYIVLAVGRFISGYYDEAKKEVEACVEKAQGKTIKLVIEAAVMTKEQKSEICKIAKEAGVEYIVASTGFEPYGVAFPTIDDIKELCEVSHGVKIIACGDISTVKQAKEMLNAGAHRICTDKAYDLCKELF